MADGPSSEGLPIIAGDTIEVLHNGNAQRVRLHDIDCPEKGQPFGNNAKQAISPGSIAYLFFLQISTVAST